MAHRNCRYALVLAAAAFCLMVVPPQVSAAPAMPGFAQWLLAFSGPCPNCDARQTLHGKTVFPSPLPAAREKPPEIVRPLDGSPLPDTLTWPRLREWLSKRPPAPDPQTVMKSISVCR